MSEKTKERETEIETKREKERETVRNRGREERKERPLSESERLRVSCLSIISDPLAGTCTKPCQGQPKSQRESRGFTVCMQM